MAITAELADGGFASGNNVISANRRLEKWQYRQIWQRRAKGREDGVVKPLALAEPDWASGKAPRFGGARLGKLSLIHI